MITSQQQTRADADGPLVVNFQDSFSVKHSLVGGKGANLGRLFQADFKVPSGFTITTIAYKQFMTSTGIDEQIAARVSEIDFADSESVEKSTSEIRRIIVNEPLPEFLTGLLEVIPYLAVC